MSASIATALTSRLPAVTLSPPRVQWRQVVGFSTLAYAMSWLWWTPIVWPHLEGLTITGGLPDVLRETGAGRAALGMLGPALAALTMRVMSGERIEGLGTRRPWRYYVIAVAAPTLFVASVVVVDVSTGLGRFVSSGSLMGTFTTVLLVGGALSLPLALGEEYGWRGYLLPRLLPLGEIRATLILAAIWGAWHTPILLIGLNYPGQPLWAVLPVFVIGVILIAFPFTWLYVASARSVLVVAVMHSVLNAVGDTFTSARYIPGANPLIVSGGGLVGAGILLVVVGAWTAFRHQSHQPYVCEARG
jgi:membrane protease YdiL (CAAX protease family)